MSKSIFDIAVIGLGAAGAFAAIAAAAEGANVTVFEKNAKTGKKLYITGKGRANITNDCAVQEFLLNIISNPKAATSALYNFTPQNLMEFFTSRGLKLKTERGGRVFPESDKSSDVIKVLNAELAAQGVKINYNSTVKKIYFNTTQNTFFVDEDAFDKIIIATGGISYPQTGSSGDGYKFAKKFGHTIIEPVPGLCGLLTEKFDLAGLSLKNVALSVFDDEKKLFEEQGEMLFTHDGISGPIVLTASSKAGRILQQKTLTASINFKPALTKEVLDARLVREFDAAKNKAVKNIMPVLLPSALSETVLSAANLDGEKKANAVTKEERQRLLKTLQDFRFRIVGTEGAERAIITAGGVNLKEINPRTFESKLQKGLYFAGEVLDFDAETGGFNLHLAFVTGYAAGKNACKN